MYYLADVLTLLRVVGTAAILGLAGFGNAADTLTVLVLFALSELTDAFDGMAARRWPYPQDGKRRWWRTYAEEIDQIADLALGGAATLFVGLHLAPGLALAIAVGVVGFALPVQVWRQYRIRRIPYEECDPLRVRVILARRWLYLVALAALILCMLGHLVLSLPAAARGQVVAALAVVLVIIAVGLIWLKRDRLARDKPKRLSKR